MFNIDVKGGTGVEACNMYSCMTFANRCFGLSAGELSQSTRDKEYSKSGFEAFVARDAFARELWVRRANDTLFF